MVVNTRIFGEIDIEESKIITFEKGIIGMPDFKKFTLIYDSDKKDSNIRWLQSLDDGTMALPVVDPLIVLDKYEPLVNAELMERLGEYDATRDLMILVTLRVPSDLREMTINLKGPIIINTANNRAVQIIVDDDYPVRFPIYEILQENREKAKKLEERC